MLLEDVPGTAKTILARAIAQSVGETTFARIQCTPDLQPTDITGLSIFDQRTREFEFRPGPVFANVVLVDEINRAMPRTQSALLEAMAERQVTVDGVDARVALACSSSSRRRTRSTRRARSRCPRRSWIASRCGSRLGYPREDEEISIVVAQRHGHPIERLQPVVGAEELGALQRAVEDVYVDELVLRWTVQLARATREVDGVAIGASVRGSLTLERTARAWALLEGRGYVVPEDIERLFLPVLGHRLLLTASYLAETPRARPRRGAQPDPRALPGAGAAAGPGLGAVSSVVGGRRTFPLVPRRR